jgi:lipopolysaccharide export LptBFGC system permease protein LptF
LANSGRCAPASRLLLASQGAIACAMYYALLEAGDVGTRDGWLNGVVAAWLPNCLFVATAAGLSLRSRFVASGV